MKLNVMASTLVVVIVLAVLAAAVSAQTATPTAADAPASSPNNMADLLSSALASDKPLTFDFVVPLVTGERVWSVPDSSANRTISAIGADYVCFSEPWNDGFRERCTPFSNISSITFLK